MSQDVTVIIPTFNRPEMLPRTLSFLQNTANRLPIIVADGSDAENSAHNLETCRRAGANVSYVHIPAPPEIADAAPFRRYLDLLAHYFRRYLLALTRVATRYVVHCGDDDLLMPEAIIESAEFLDGNSEYVACHGMYFNFRFTNRGVDIESSTYDGPAIDGNEFGSRVIQLFSRYESPYAAVYRAPVQRAILERLVEMPGTLFSEIFHATATLVEGKVKRLDRIYYLRNIGVPSNPRPFEHWDQWILKDLDGFFACYLEYRTRITAFADVRMSPAPDPDRLRRTIDLAFMLFVGRQFSMAYWIYQYLATAVVAQEERDRLSILLNERLLAPPPSQPPPTPQPVDEVPSGASGDAGPFPLRVPPEIAARHSPAQWELLRSKLQPGQTIPFQSIRSHLYRVFNWRGKPSKIPPGQKADNSN
jgi:glycosyltransferase domain-containing protein